MLLGTSEEIIDAKNLVATVKQPVDQMRAQETCAPRHQDAFATVVVTRHDYS